jgi:hypothetical protein
MYVVVVEVLLVSEKYRVVVVASEMVLSSVCVLVMNDVVEVVDRLVSVT